MQRDLGLTEQQVKDRLKVESAATKLVPTAQRAAGAAFGGVWYDSAKQRLVVGLTSSATASAVWATGADVALVSLTAKQLDQRKAAVDKLAGKAVPAAVSGWTADPRTGAVVVNVQAGKRSAAVDAFVTKVSTAGAVTVREVVAQAPRTFAARHCRWRSLLHGQRPLLHRLLRVRRIRLRRPLLSWCRCPDVRLGPFGAGSLPRLVVPR
nr:alpha-lytic protease prodomain-containing protein [Kribbella qitaiheensis]